MRRFIAILPLLAACATSHAQGTIDFVNRNIPTAADPTVIYNVPIYWPIVGRALGVGAGNIAGGITVGLFLAGAADNATPIVTTPLRTGTPTQAQFFAIGSQTAAIPGIQPGATANLLVRAWQGSSFVAAKSSGLLFDEWIFTSQPLGGTPPVGLPIPTPAMTGWGREDGSGFQLFAFSFPPPSTPEPPTIRLVAFAATLLLAFRRKRRQA